MYNFNKNFGHRITIEANNYYYHRRSKIGITALCNSNIELWYHTALTVSTTTNFNNICPACLSTVLKKELDKIKMYFIIRKLKGN